MRTDADRFAEALALANGLKQVTDILYAVDLTVRAGFHPYDQGVGSRLVQQLIAWQRTNPETPLAWPIDVKLARELAGEHTGAFPPFIGRPIDVTEDI